MCFLDLLGLGRRYYQSSVCETNKSFSDNFYEKFIKWPLNNKLMLDVIIFFSSTDFGKFSFDEIGE